MDDAVMKVLTWNVFHTHDGHPAARPNWRSTLLGEPVDSGTHLHLNRTFEVVVGAFLGRAKPTVTMLQEVPPWAVGRIADIAGMAAVSALTAPRIGPVSLRGLLGRLNPDLVRTHEGNANVVLVRPPWEIVPGSSRVVRLNPPALVWQTARRARMEPLRVLDWIWERRNLITARIRHPDGRLVQVACCHCHTDPRAGALEIPRAGGAALDAADGLPLILGGDLNGRVEQMPETFRGLERRGLARVPCDDGLDHILTRSATPVGAARRWQPGEREIVVPWKGETRRVRISDHAPVEAVLRPETGI